MCSSDLSASFVDVKQLANWLDQGDTCVIDLSTAAQFIKGHISGAWGMLRSTLGFDVKHLLALKGNLPSRVVLTCADGSVSPYAQTDVQHALEQAGWQAQVHVLSGGNGAWAVAGQPLSAGTKGLLAQRIDRYRRPYEGTSNAHAAMQAYLDWEFGLVEQLKRDGTHHFNVI